MWFSARQICQLLGTMAHVRGLALRDITVDAMQRLVVPGLLTVSMEDVRALSRGLAHFQAKGTEPFAWALFTYHADTLLPAQPALHGREGLLSGGGVGGRNRHEQGHGVGVGAGPWAGVGLGLSNWDLTLVAYVVSRVWPRSWTVAAPRTERARRAAAFAAWVRALLRTYALPRLGAADSIDPHFHDYLTTQPPLSPFSPIGRYKGSWQEQGYAQGHMLKPAQVVTLLHMCARMRLSAPEFVGPACDMLRSHVAGLSEDSAVQLLQAVGSLRVLNAGLLSEVRAH